MPITGVFNVQDYGAAGNGTKDDYGAFRAALAAAAPSGGVVWVPPVGTSYIVDASPGPLAVPPGVTILGSVARYRASRLTQMYGSVLFDCSEGNETRRIQGLVIRGGVAGGIGIQVRANLTQLDQITFDRWLGSTCIDFNDYVVGRTRRDGPWNCHASRIAIECWDHPGGAVPGVGTIDYGIRCRGEWHASTITHCTITGAAIAGIAVERGCGSAIRNCNVEHNEAGPDAVGILVGGSGVPDTLTIDAIESESNSAAAVRVVQVNGLVLSGIYDNPSGEHQRSPYSIDINDASGVGQRVKGVVIIGGTLSEATRAGIRIHGTTDVSVLGVTSATKVEGTGNFPVRGTMSVSSAITASGGARSDAGTLQVNHDRWTTAFKADRPGMYMVYANHLDSSDGKAMATILADRTSARLALASNGAALELQLSGHDLQLRQTYGSRQAISWGYLYMPLG